MSSSAILEISLILGAALAIAGLFRPFLGMLVLIVIHFVQPGELIPALDPFRIELVYGTLLIVSFIAHRISPSPTLLFSNRIFLSALILLGAALLSIPLAVWRGGAVSAVIDLAKLIVLIVLLSMLVDSQARLRTMLWCMAAVAAWFAGTSLSGYARGDFYALQYEWGALDRAEGINSIVGGPNELAGLLLALLPLLIALVRSTRSVLARIVLMTSGAMTLAAISLTGSRIAMIGLVVMALCYAVQSKHKLLTSVACLVIGCSIWFNLPREYKQRYLTVESYATGGQLDASNEFRLEIWKAGGRIFLRNPIVGVGAGQFPTAYGLIYLNGRHAAWMNPHNLLIQIACELGLVGLAAFCYFLAQIARGIKFVLHKTRNGATKLNYQTAIACCIMSIGTLILSLVGHTLYRPYWYLLAGLVAANHNIVVAKIRARSKYEATVSERVSTPSDNLETAFAMSPDEGVV